MMLPEDGMIPGEVVGLAGPGSFGKTTLFNIIGCIFEPDGGRMALDGEAIHDGQWLNKNLRRLRLTQIGFVFHFHHLIPFRSVHGNKMFDRLERIIRLRDGGID